MESKVDDPSVSPGTKKSASPAVSVLPADTPRNKLLFSGVSPTTRMFLISLLILLVILVPLGMWLVQTTEKTVDPGLTVTENIVPGNATQEPFEFSDPSATFMQVGDETIYYREYDYEMSVYPVLPGVNAANVVKAKMIEDSVVLQAAAAAGWVTLDSSIFNSQEIDYAARIAKVAEMKERAQKEAVNNIEGEVVAIWFMNTRPGPLGYEAGRALAEQKITTLYNQVKNSEITMAEAGEIIKADTELAQIDSAYVTNAYFKFSKDMNERIVFDDAFDAKLKALAPGELTDIHVGQDFEGRDLSIKKDALFMFGTVTNKVSSSTLTSYTDWLEQQKQTYVVK